MAEISAGVVKELRERTGLGMMECKKALTDAGGDLAKAEELLRIRSGAKAGKAASRIAADGVIGVWVSSEARLGAIIELNCETDFVAKNNDFVAFARELAGVVASANPPDVAALGQLTTDGIRIEDRRQNLVQKIGENISIRRFARLETSAKLAHYVHGGRIGVLVEYDGADEAGKDLAMHIAFSRPAYLSRAEVPDEIVARERGILAARAQESGKPAEIIAKMIEGGINKFLGEITLLGQAFVKDDKQTIEKMLAAKRASVRAYRFLVVGEGIERKTSDFVSEVKAAAGMTH